MSKARSKPISRRSDLDGAIGGDRRESRITAFASDVMCFTELTDDYEAKTARLEGKLPELTARIDERNRQRAIGTL